MAPVSFAEGRCQEESASNKNLPFRFIILLHVLIIIFIFFIIILKTISG